MALKLFSRNRKKLRRNGKKNRGPTQPHEAEFVPAPSEMLNGDPLKRLLQQGRYNVILREEEKWRAHQGGDAVVDTAFAELEKRMALVPAGSVTISKTLTAQPGTAEEDLDVETFMLDVHCITNARFQRFVDAGGYDALEFWPEEFWPHLIELKDVTGQPNPRFWRNGRHNALLADHPVVGVSWYEAQACALWSGLRLATEAEWQMAASWHVKSSTDVLRRFPWGDAMDNTRCNIWSSRQGGTVPVSEYATGAAPNQVRQLTGNVWEWTDTEYEVTDDEGRHIVGEMPMHVVRGGAFDTYFETQATNYFRTGHLALARTHNIGFRCAMDLSQARWINGE